MLWTKFTILLFCYDINELLSKICGSQIYICDVYICIYLIYIHIYLTYIYDICTCDIYVYISVNYKSSIVIR